jgi:hypothetical protein
MKKEQIKLVNQILDLKNEILSLELQIKLSKEIIKDKELQLSEINKKNNER